MKYIIFFHIMHFIPKESIKVICKNRGHRDYVLSVLRKDDNIIIDNISEED